MHQQLKKYLSLFFLSLFLFPMVEMQVHAFEHKDDLHCTSADKHFHPLEHNCSICDYTSTDSNSSTENNFSTLIFSSTFNFIPFIESVNIPDTFCDLPARAPPIV
jgi:hypothetical protein